jgi:carboxyl-terminal processing protease
MIQRVVRSAFLLALPAALLGLFVALPRSAADPTPGKQDRLVTQMVVGFLQQAHIAKPEIADDISKRLFGRFFKSLDPTKLYFLQSDIDEFKKSETQLDDQVLQGEMPFAYAVYERFLARQAERQKLIAELVKAPHDFTVKEYLDTDYDKQAWAKDEAELRERWRKRIKFDLLLHKIGQKPLADAEARQKVLSRYDALQKRWKQVDGAELLEIFLTDLTTSIDPHSTYMSPNTLEDFDVSMRLNLEGIGALLRQEDGQTIIAEVIAGGAAADDKRLKVNDKIIAVAQGEEAQFTDVQDRKLRDVVKLIRGPAGTQVQLKVIPAGKLEPVVYKLTRRKVELKSQEARSEIIEQGKKPDGQPYRVGVIDLPSFYADTVALRAGNGGGAKSATGDVRRILQDFNSKGVDGVVLDLRRNGGGSLTEAVALTGLFLDKGPVVQIKGSTQGVRRMTDPEAGYAYDGPLVVLTSKLSASASEILAGALQDYGRALVVGDSTTHGKGSVQIVLDLADQVRGGAADGAKLGALKLTIQKFYRVNGDSTQNRGVAADVVVPSLTDVLGLAEGELDHALPFDRLKPVTHDELGQASDQLKADLQTRSAKRVKESTDFGKLQKEIEQAKQRKERKQLPLNEQELKGQVGKDEADKLEHGLDGEAPEKGDGTAYKFARNFANKELLQIAEDYFRARDKQGR